MGEGGEEEERECVIKRRSSTWGNFWPGTSMFCGFQASRTTDLLIKVFHSLMHRSDVL